MAAKFGGFELQEAPQPLAVGLVTASSHAAPVLPGAMPAMLPGMATYAPMLPSRCVKMGSEDGSLEV